MANRYNVQFLQTPNNKSTLISCNFVVDSTNGNGLGIRSLKGSRVKDVYMHTSATPDPKNPNPASGVIRVNMQDNYKSYLGGFSGQVSALSGSTILVNSSSVLTIGNPYVIVSLGTTTQAQWVAAGLSAKLIAAVGVSFIAQVTGAAGGTGAVQAPASAGSGIDHIEVLGDPNLANSSTPSNSGQQFTLLCFSGTTLTAPANGSVISLSFYYNDSDGLNG